MSRKPREISPSGIYHVIWRGLDKMQLFYSPADYLAFLNYLSLIVDDSFVLIAYCLMGNHIHLVLKTSKKDCETLSIKMKQLGVRYDFFL